MNALLDTEICVDSSVKSIGMARSAAVVIVILTISVNVGLILDAMSQGRSNKHHADPASALESPQQPGTANGHAVGSSGSSGVSVRRSNQLKLQAGFL